MTVVMDERILSARDVTKSYARGGGFDATEMGTLGTVAIGGVEFFYQPVRKHTASADFDVASLESLPRVGISYSYRVARASPISTRKPWSSRPPASRQKRRPTTKRFAARA